MNEAWKDKVAIVTGGNTGIGKETVRGLAGLGGTVVLACRDPHKGEEARRDIASSSGNERVEVMQLDLASGRSIRAFAAEFRRRHGRLDVLVNNAGVWPRSRTTTEDGFESTFGVNHLGPFLLTQELVELLRASAPARVVNVSSRLHYRGRMTWDDLEFTGRSFGGMAAYAQSKLANVLFTLALARRLEGSGVTANCLHPGVVQTELARELPRLLVKIFSLFTISPAEGARTSLYLASAPEVAEVSGKYFEKCREMKPLAAALELEAQERLWRLSETMWSEKLRQAA